MQITRLLREPPLVPPDKLQRYGVEIEIENALHVGEISHPGWRVTHDGSLRGISAEFVSVPATLEEHAVMQDWFYHYYHHYGWTGSVRTGIHVHADMTHYNLAQVGAIVAVYCIAEPLLYNMVGNVREECIYCVPWYRSRDDAVQFGRALRYAGGDGMKRDILRRSCKYSGMYVEPLTRFGTLEFRQAPTFDSLEQMMAWLHTIDRLVHTGLSYKCAEHVHEAALDDLRPILSAVFGQVSDSELRQVEEADVLGVAGCLVRTSPTPGAPWFRPEIQRSRHADSAMSLRGGRRLRHVQVPTPEMAQMAASPMEITQEHPLTDIGDRIRVTMEQVRNANAAIDRVRSTRRQLDPVTFFSQDLNANVTIQDDGIRTIRPDEFVAEFDTPPTPRRPRR